MSKVTNRFRTASTSSRTDEAVISAAETVDIVAMVIEYAVTASCMNWRSIYKRSGGNQTFTRRPDEKLAAALIGYRTRRIVQLSRPHPPASTVHRRPAMHYQCPALQRCRSVAFALHLHCVASAT